MSPLSGPVLAATALVASPAVWMASQGVLPVQDAALRALVVLLVCWVGLSALEAVLSTAPSRPDPRTEAATPPLEEPAAP